MLYLFSEILVSLLLALALGVFLGWLIWFRGSKRRVREIEARSQHERARLQDELRQVNSELRETDIAFEESEVDRERVLENLEEFRAAVGERNARISILQGELQAYETRLQALAGTASEKGALIESLTARLAELDNRVPAQEEEPSKLRAELSRSEVAIAKHRAELEAKAAEADSLAADAIERKRRIAELEQMLAEQEPQAPDLPPLLDKLAETQAAVTSLRSEADAAALQIQTVDADLRTPAAAVLTNIEPQPPQNSKSVDGSRPPADIAKDDLKRINGIGPALERLLNRIGVSTYQQIARWNPQEIDKVQSRLKTFPNRIRKDNWVSGAKHEHYKKYGERI